VTRRVTYNAPAAPSAPSSASARSLDWFTFFLADIQTGFGPFVAIYLTAHAWPQFDIGLVLTAEVRATARV
jgi:isocitrate lyase